MKNRRFRLPSMSRLVLAIALGSAALDAAAHTAWLEPDAGAYRVLYGGHAGEILSYPAEKLISVTAYDANGAPVAVRREDGANEDGVRIHPQGEAAVLLLHFDNGIWSKPDGGRSINLPMNEVPGATSGVHAVKYHKTIARWGATATRSWGQPFEVVALDAAPPRAGVPLRLRVLIDGRPAAGIKVSSDESGPDNLTDADGVVSVLPQPGFNKIWAGQRTSVAHEPRFTTLSIEYLFAFDAEPAR